MATDSSDSYPTQATDRWTELLPDTDLSTMKAGIRFERLAHVLEQDLAVALRPFAHRGVRTMEDFRFLALLRTDRFLKAGLIERTVVAHDRRNTLVTIQESTHPLVDGCQLALNDVHLRMFSPLNKTEIKELTALLDKLAD